MAGREEGVGWSGFLESLRRYWQPLRVSRTPRSLRCIVRSTSASRMPALIVTHRDPRRRGDTSPHPPPRGAITHAPAGRPGATSFDNTDISRGVTAYDTYDYKVESMERLAEVLPKSPQACRSWPARASRRRGARHLGHCPLAATMVILRDDLAVGHSTPWPSYGQKRRRNVCVKDPFGTGRCIY